MTLLILLGLVVAAGVPYILWTRMDARKASRAIAVHEDVQSMGDELVPVSIHPEVDLDACIGSSACIRACPEDDILAITDGRARLINPMSCIGHGACMSACPVGAITLVFGTAKRGIELPKLTSTFETSQAGIYIVGELGGMGLIRNAVEQGRQAAAAIAKSGRRGSAGDLDTIVVGGGPAGISAALALIAHGHRTLIVDQDRFGGTITHYPRAKVVMTGSFELAGYGTVRRKTMSKEQLLELWTDIRERTQLDIKEGVRVESIRAERNAWRVSGASWSDHAPNVVLALGRRGAPNELGVPGEDLPKVAYRLIEPDPFAGKHVMIVGGGNAAADCAIALAQAAICASVAISYRKDKLARLRGSVRTELDRCFKTGAIQPLLSTEVKSITEDHVTLKTPEGMKQIRNDNVIIQIGGQPPSALLKTIGIELVEKRGEA
ncbi:MAG: FAD-dependent pyridine nucleotide-disulfide oxidoreductase [Myxococcales bacterium]|nr:FAD-dependent pyridine nucleotide-disulfide oxidoreductase [Myxococcales bacterium]